MGFLTWLFMLVLWLGSISIGVIAAAAMVTYVRRTWQLIHAEEDGTVHDRILDGLDRIETRLAAMRERIDALERPSERIDESERRSGRIDELERRPALTGREEATESVSPIPERP